MPFAARSLRKPLPSLVAVCAAVLLVTPAPAAWYEPDLPSLDKLTDYQPAQSLQVFTQDGVELGQFGAERRQFVPLAQTPKLLQDALVAVEDARFREHHGIDFIGVARAVVANLTPGAHRQGASTITQQVARNFFLSNRLTAERKLKEAMLALKIERELSKDRILELYMNQIYLGQRAYGFAAASQVYFGKPMAQLDAAECAMLAGLPQNPVYANPITNFDKARQRQLVVLDRMRATGVIDERHYAAAKAEKLSIRSPLKAPLHAEYVAEMARLAVHQRYGDRAYTQGFKVYTSIVSRDQQAAWSALRRGVLAYDRKQPYRGPEDQEDFDPAKEEAQAAARTLKDHPDDEQLRVAIVTQASPKAVTARLASGQAVTLDDASLRWARAALAPHAGKALAMRRGAVIRVIETPQARGASTWALSQWPEVQSAFVSLDPASGRIRSLVGGFDFRHGQFNHVTSAWRQPGSGIKPLLYSAALEHGVMPATLVNDAAFEQGGWEPRNSDMSLDGPVTLRQALARSKNLVSIRVVQQTGVQDAIDWAARFGLDADKQPRNLTLALGAGSVTPLQMASAYAVFANGGWRLPPVLIERITDAQGKVLFEAAPAPAREEANRAIPARNAFVMQSLLQEVTHTGTAARAGQALQRADVYGKTGTTNDAVDAWFSGFQPSLVAVAWMGYDDPRSLGERESGGGLSLPVWVDYMRSQLAGVPVVEPVVPEGLVRVEMNGVADWSYADLPAGQLVERIDLPPPQPPQAPEAPASAPALSLTPEGSPAR